MGLKLSKCYGGLNWKLRRSRPHRILAAMSGPVMIKAFSRPSSAKPTETTDFGGWKIKVIVYIRNILDFDYNSKLGKASHLLRQISANMFRIRDFKLFTWKQQGRQKFVALIRMLKKVRWFFVKGQSPKSSIHLKNWDV